MKSFIGIGALGAALLLAGCGEGTGGNSAAGGSGGSTAAAIPAPNGGDWTETVSQTPEGGFVMGNPNAPVKLVEYASMTCSHCADFARTGEEPLIDKYVKTGQVSFEIRNYIRDPADLAAAMLARCNGPAAFFKLSDQMFAAQSEWMGKLQTMTPAQQQQLAALEAQGKPLPVVAALAQQAGLVDFARVRGVPTQKAQQCLANEGELNRLVQMQQKATADYPNFAGTPSFVLNGKMLENTGTWEALEPQIKAAIG